MLEFDVRPTVPDMMADLKLDMDAFSDIDIRMDDLDSEEDPLADFAMEHCLDLFHFDNMKDLSLSNDGPMAKSGEKRSILDELDTKDKIRQDCMWSTGHHNSKQMKADPSPHYSRLTDSLYRTEEMSLTPPTSYINQYFTHMETPIPSDEESSSGDEIDVSSDWSSIIIDQENRLNEPPTVLTNKDHSYSNFPPATMTPPDSSEDEEPCSPGATDIHRTKRALTSIDNDRLNQAVQSILKPVEKFKKPTSKPKFLFKINIKSQPGKNSTRHLDQLRMLTSKSKLKKASIRKSNFVSLVKHLPGSEEEDEEMMGKQPRDARDLHNHMERQRRTELKRAFDTVKKCVPTISTSDRVSKQMILDKAIEFCRGLRQKDASLGKCRRSLEEKNSLLRKRLKALQMTDSL